MMMPGPVWPMMPDRWAHMYGWMMGMGTYMQAAVAAVTLAAVVLAVAGVVLAMRRDRQAGGKTA